MDQIFSKPMKIDFSTIEETVIPQFKGGEKETAARMYFDGLNRC